SNQENVLEQNQKNVLKTSQTNVPKPKENNIPNSSQENVPNSNKEKILKHKGLPLVRNNTSSFVKTQAQYNKKNISLSEVNQIVKQVVNYAVQHKKNMTAINFNLNASIVGRQIKASSNWIAKTHNKSKQIGSAVIYEIIQNRMMEILQQPAMVALYNDFAKIFKMSYRWTVAFIKRNKLALRRHTKISQKLSKQTQELLEKFYKHIAQLKSQKFFELGNILNMDEIPVWFDMASNFTVNLKDEKTVHIRAMGGAGNTAAENLRHAQIDDVCT
ncbi:9587_t:CDS:2, partial [Gigaspora margarita]